MSARQSQTRPPQPAPGMPWPLTVLPVLLAVGIEGVRGDPFLAEEDVSVEQALIPLHSLGHLEPAVTSTCSRRGREADRHVDGEGALRDLPAEGGGVVKDGLVRIELFVEHRTVAMGEVLGHAGVDVHVNLLALFEQRLTQVSSWRQVQESVTVKLDDFFPEP